MSRKLWLKTCALLLAFMGLMQLSQAAFAGDDEIDFFFRGCRGEVEVDD